MQACLDAVAKISCTQDADVPECTAVLDGTVAVGDACDLDAECNGSDTYCKISAGCPGTCSPRELVGGACERDDQCASGLKCDSGTSQCFQPAALGGACGGTVAPDCGAGGFCIGADDDAKTAGTCMPIEQAFSVPQGGDCFFNGASACSSGLFCVVEGVDTVAQKLIATCQSGFASGAACHPSIPDACPQGEYCVVPAQSFDGTCTAKPAAGEACGTLFDGSVCAMGTRCDNNVCTPRQNLGGNCSGNGVCYSDSCVGGQCVAKGACQ